MQKTQQDAAFLLAGGAGHLSITEGQLSGRFLGGRLHSLHYNGNPAINPQRIQGYAQTHHGIEYSQTRWSTWFEREGDRGLQELSELNTPDGVVEVRSEFVVLDSVPALIVRLQTQLPPAPSTTYRRFSPWSLLVNRSPGTNDTGQKSADDPPGQGNRTRQKSTLFQGTHANVNVRAFSGNTDAEVPRPVQDIDIGGRRTVTFHPLLFITDAPLPVDQTVYSRSLVMYSPEIRLMPIHWKRIRAELRRSVEQNTFFYSDSISPE